MCTIKNLTKNLVLLTLGDLTIDPNYVIHAEQSDENSLALELSIKEDGYQGAMTAIQKDGKTIVINGNRSYQTLLNLYGTEYEVYVWVYEDEMTEEQIKLLILALGKVRKKLRTDILTEFEIWDKVIPSNQGKNDVDKKRIQKIADRIGVSTSILNKLIRINKADPDLIRQLDVGDTNLAKAEDTARKMEKEKLKSQVEADGKPVVVEPDKTRYADKNVDLDALPTCCPTCNRQLSTITPEEIPSIFNVDRQEKNNQLTWMQKKA